MAKEYSPEQLRAAWVQEPPKMNTTVTLSEYDEQWPLLFQREAARIRTILGDNVRMLEHIGSTSVPGLCAKPIVDMLLVVPDSSDEARYAPALEQAGYKLVIREPDWHQHRVFKGPDTNINLHVFSPGSPEIERNLGFRDHLRINEDDRNLYAAEKRRLAEQTWEYIQHYADAKGPVVEQILARALARLKAQLPSRAQRYARHHQRRQDPMVHNRSFPYPAM